MSTENNRKLVEDYMDAWAAGNAARLETLLDASFTFENPPPGIAADKDGAIDMSAQYHAAFPDLKMRYTKWVVQGDDVCVRAVATGTHRGDFLGIPPTNRSAEVTGIALVTVRNGKVIADASEFDMLGLLQKLGAIPELGGGVAGSRPPRPARAQDRSHETVAHPAGSR